MIYPLSHPSIQNYFISEYYVPGSPLGIGDIGQSFHSDNLGEEQTRNKRTATMKNTWESQIISLLKKISYVVKSVFRVWLRLGEAWHRWDGIA